MNPAFSLRSLKQVECRVDGVAAVAQEFQWQEARPRCRYGPVLNPKPVE